jgi:hypothetical protein
LPSDSGIPCHIADDGCLALQGRTVEAETRLCVSHYRQTLCVGRLDLHHFLAPHV